MHRLIRFLWGQRLRITDCLACLFLFFFLVFTDGLFSVLYWPINKLIKIFTYRPFKVPTQSQTARGVPETCHAGGKKESSKADKIDNRHRLRGRTRRMKNERGYKSMSHSALRYPETYSNVYFHRFAVVCSPVAPVLLLLCSTFQCLKCSEISTEHFYFYS